MTNAALIEVGDEVVASLVSFKNNTSQRALKLLIENESLIASTKIPVKGTYQSDFDSLQEYLQRDQPSFILVRLEATSVHPEFLLIVYIPPSCPVRPRTIFASGRVPVQRRLSQIFTGLGDYFIDDVKELSYSQYAHVSNKDEGAMSLEEIQARREAAETAVGQVNLPQHDTFTWPVEDELTGLLRTFASGSGPKLVAGKASPTGGAISLAGTGSSLSDIDSSGPRYVAIRYDDNGKLLKVFLLFCPDTAQARQKMMSSTCKASFLKACEEVGLAFDRSLEIRDVSEFNDSNLALLVNPPVVDHGWGELKIARKPKAPGRK